MAVLDKDTIQAAITACYNYFQNNKGDTKPNAANAAGIPYHANEAGYHWQIHEGSTTSECLTLMCRAMAEAGYSTYAKQLADYIINSLTHDDVETVHWLVNLIDSGVEMETVMCGNYDNAIFTFTNGVATIPAGYPYYGESVVPVVDSRYYGVRSAWSTDTTWQYKDYWLNPESGGTEYPVSSYSTSGAGTVITLEDTGYSGDLQVYYGYRNGNLLNANELYRSYPLNTPCVVPYYTLVDESGNYIVAHSGENIVSNNETYQLSNATDGTFWAIIAFNKLAAAISDITYSDKADALLAENLSNSNVVTDGQVLFSATDRAASFNSTYIYEEDEGRNAELYEENDVNNAFTRFDFQSGSGVVKWGISEAFSWTAGDLIAIVKGDGSGAVRNIILNDGEREYYSAWFDNSNEAQTLRLSRGNFGTIDNIFLDHNRIPYLAPYVYPTSWDYYGYPIYVNYISYLIQANESEYEDSEQLNYPLEYVIPFSIPGYYKYGSEGLIQASPGSAGFGSGHIGGVETANGSQLTFIMHADTELSNVRCKVIDANDNHIECKYPIVVGTVPAEYNIPLDSNYFNGTIVHPIKNVELLMKCGLPAVSGYDHTFTSSDVQTDTGTGWTYVHYRLNYSGIIYLKSIKIGKKRTPPALINVIDFATRQAEAGFFNISSVRLEQGNTDAYPYAGVPVFSLEYTDTGLMGWRSGSYTGYTNPYALTPATYDSLYACKFLYDAQKEYKKDFGIHGPFYPVYLRNLKENTVYGSLGSWTWNGPDPNTTWAGFQYRALAAIADHRYFNRNLISANEIGYCWNILNGWANFLYTWIRLNDTLPAYFASDGSITAEYESPDFYALAGRAMLLKHLVDWDKKSLYIYQWCYDKLLDLQQVNGSFNGGGGQDTYGFHQAEAILFLAELYNYFDEYKYTAGLTVFTYTPNKIHTAAIEFRTQIFESFSGKEQRQSDTQYPIRRWRLTFNKDNSNLSDIRAYFNNLKGRYSTFQWTWSTDIGGDGNTYTCRIAEDNMVAAMNYLGYANFDFVFEAIDTNAYSNLNSFVESHNSQYEHQEQRKTVIDGQIAANMAVNVQWQESRKRWNLVFEKTKESRQWLENFFISQKGRLKEWEFTWDEDKGGDGETYNVRFDTDTLDFDVLYYGFGRMTVPIIEVL